MYVCMYVCWCVKFNETIAGCMHYQLSGMNMECVIKVASRQQMADRPSHNGAEHQHQ